MGDCEQGSLETTDATLDPGPGNDKTWAAFLEHFAQCGVVTEAADVAGCHRATIYRWLDNSPRCKAEFADAEEAAADVLRTEARRRAVQGVDEPVFYQGQICGYVRKYSNSLMAKLLNAHCPEHKDESTLNLQGPCGGAMQFEVKPPPEVAQILSDVLREAAAEPQ